MVCGVSAILPVCVGNSKKGLSFEEFVVELCFGAVESILLAKSLHSVRVCSQRFIFLQRAE
jgi:hypothetical protein